MQVAVVLGKTNMMVLRRLGGNTVVYPGSGRLETKDPTLACLIFIVGSIVEHSTRRPSWRGYHTLHYTLLLVRRLACLSQEVALWFCYATEKPRDEVLETSPLGSWSSLCLSPYESVQV